MNNRKTLRRRISIATIALVIVVSMAALPGLAQADNFAMKDKITIPGVFGCAGSLCDTIGEAVDVEIQQDCMEAGAWLVEIQYISGTGVYGGSIDCGSTTIAQTDKVHNPGDIEADVGDSQDGQMHCFLDVYEPGEAELLVGCEDPINPELGPIVPSIRWFDSGAFHVHLDTTETGKVIIRIE